MIKAWDDFAWEDSPYWQTQHKKTLKRINLLLRDIERNGNDGLGKPEPHCSDLQGYWSRRIDKSGKKTVCSKIKKLSKKSRKIFSYVI